MKNKVLAQVVSMLLVFLLVLGNTQIGQTIVFAADETVGDEVFSGMGEIVSFEELSSEIAVQSVSIGTDKTALNLPDILMAKVGLPVEETSTEETFVVTDPAINLFIQDEQNQEGDGQNDTEEVREVSEPVIMDIPVPVTWTSSPSYDGDTAGIYTFTPAIEGFTVSTELPLITVTVREATKTESKSIDGVITEFSELPEDIRWQNTMTSEFPETVEGIINGTTAEIPVTWEADHPYDADYPQRGLYVFTAVLGDGYEAAYGTELPRITVYIPQNAGRMMRMAVTCSPKNPSIIKLVPMI